MLFTNWRKKNSGTSKMKKIKVDRESVCMGDNCNAPHEVTLLVPICGGSLSFWGENFGRPHDNFHRIETVRWESDNISIHFSEAESLYVTDPVGIVNNEHQFTIQDATKVLWVWYCYGEERTYENMLVLQYEKDDKGMMI